MNEKKQNEEPEVEHPKIIWAKEIKIVEKKPPNDKIISYKIFNDSEN